MNNIVKTLKGAHAFYIATMDGDQPRVRPFSTIAEFEGNAYVCSGRQKEVARQIRENPKIELSAMLDGGSWVRISAVAVEDPRVEAEAAVLEDPTGPSQLYKPGDGRFIVYRLTEIKALSFNFYSAPTEIKEHD